MLLTIVSFIVLMSVLVFVHEFGHFIVAKRNHIVVEEFAFGFPPRLIKVAERGGTVYAINAIPFGGYVRLRGEDDPSLPGSFAAAPKLARVATLLAGPVMNLLLAVVLFAVLVQVSGVPDYSKVSNGAEIGAVSPDSPAAQAGLRVGDRIIAANGSPVKNFNDLVTATRANLGQPVTYRIERGSQQLDVTLTPRVNPPPGEGAVGIASAAPPMRPARPWESLVAGLQNVWALIVLTFQVPAALIRQGRPIGDAGFMGPVGIAAVTGQVVRSSLAIESILPVVQFVAALSTALGLTNILPVPGLDGGRLLFVLIEAVRRKRVEPAQEGLVHLAGLGLLLVLVAMLTVHEVTALVNGTFPSITH